ncbi:transcriptional regulator [Staphylococcus gallinarum]|uniref:transcriptional regulator n=1 Tax=Staphylococcus gallinarum TaxID=1293 RepID=UPI0030BFE0F2
MQELKRIDYVKLEDYIENIDKYRTDLKFREYELLSNHEPDNPEGGKANIVNSPIEQQVVKCQQDPRYRRLSDIVHGVDMFLAECDEQAIEIFRLKYWDKPFDCNTWDAIADRYYTSKSSMLNYKSALLRKLADKIGYI